MFLETELHANEVLMGRLSKWGPVIPSPAALLLIVEAGSQPIGLWKPWRIRVVKWVTQDGPAWEARSPSLNLPSQIQKHQIKSQ